MKKVGLMMLGLTAAACVQAAPANDALTPAQTQQVQSEIHDYILQNPEVIMQSVQTLQEKMQKQQMDDMKKEFQQIQSSASNFTAPLFHQASDPVAGNPNGKITVVEFFDYQCPHCIEVTPEVDALLKDNKDVRLVLKEFPIRGAMSEFAARAALAAKQQGKYYELHQALMSSQVEPLTQDAIFNLAKSLGLDVVKLKAAMNSAEVNKQIQDNYALAKGLKLIYTPAFFIAKSTADKNTTIIFVPGRATEQQLQEAVAAAAK